MKRPLMKSKITITATVLMLILTMAGSSMVLTGCGDKASTSVAAEDIAALEGARDEAFAKNMTETLAYDEALNDPDTIYRGAGSAAEIAASEYLEKQWKKIGLTDVSRDAVTVDGWQTGESYMNISDIKVKDMVPYPTTGSHTVAGEANPVKIRDLSQGETGDVMKTIDKDWSNMEIVNVGNGTVEEFEAVDVEGKIALVAVNQMMETWIDQPYTEAYYQGAAAIVTYQYDIDGIGYGMYDLIDNEKDCDTINIQDICANNYIPCGSISPKDASKILKQMKKDKTDTLGNVDFKLTCDVKHDTTAYNVVGKIPGTENTGQQIIISGHYDKYHGGVNDDVTAIALTASIAKAMIESGYQPKNDIYFVAHAAEEWGRIGASNDWAIGSWEQITEVHPEWQGTTLAMINFEMPAIQSGQEEGIVCTSYEFDTAINDYIEQGMLSSDHYKKGVSVSNDHGMGMSDSIAYQRSGVPCVMNSPDFENPIEGEVSSSGDWFMDRYHTVYDDMSTYSSDLMEYNIGFYGGMAIYLDSNPALELNFDARCEELMAEIEDTGNYLTKDQQTLIDQYKTNLEAMQAAGTAQLEKAQAINAEYEEAYNGEASDEELAAIFKKGVELNKVTLQAFRAMEDELMGITGSETNMALHMTAQGDLDLYDSVIADLKSGEVTDDSEESTLAVMAGIGGGTAYTAFVSSEFTYDKLLDCVNCVNTTDVWNYGKSANLISDYDSIQSVFEQFYGGGKPDYSEAIAGFTASSDHMKAEMVKYLEKEIAGMAKVAEILK